MTDRPEFSVYWWDPEGNNYAERRFVPAREAVELAKSLTVRPAAMIGMIRKVMITDGGDFCVFLWEYGKGVIYPTKEELDAEAARKAGVENFPASN